jgi:4-diphosphocytidyl-2-C-methyl-D-erythritol kinase
MRSFSLKSYAKLNLTLKITGRRLDGFHELETVFERIDLHDTLRFSPRKDEKIVITSNHPDVPLDERNLVYKAAIMLRASCGIVKGATIHIEKRIPIAAGLAGGSSNGATALLGLNRLWETRISLLKLGRLAARLGSDLNFFLYDTPFALGSGRGEKIKPLASKAKLWHVVVTPDVHILAKDAYAVYAKTAAKKIPVEAGLTTQGTGVKMFLRSLKEKDISTSARMLFNDLEAPILTLCPELLALKQEMLAQQPLGVCFSGSGPSVFALTKTRQQAEKIRLHFVHRYKQAFVARTK